MDNNKEKINTIIDDEFIKEMVNRFLSWKLPENFSPDCGINFNRKVTLFIDNENKIIDRLYAGPGWWPTGTNLLNDEQAEKMIRHLLGVN